MKRKTILIMVTIILVIGGMIGIGVGKNMLDAHNMTLKRINATKELQEKVSMYIIENYEGITKIEWLGWDLNPMGTTSTVMIVNDYPAEYGADFFFYEVRDVYNTEENQRDTDLVFSITNDKNLMQQTLRTQGVKKSKIGSHDTEIIYNTQEHTGSWKK